MRRKVCAREGCDVTFRHGYPYGQNGYCSMQCLESDNPNPFPRIKRKKNGSAKRDRKAAARHV